MKVLHLLKSNKYSGAENVVLTIMDICSDDEMIYASPEGSIHKVVEERGHRFYPLPELSIREVKNAIRAVHPDIVHAHDFSMASLAAWSAGDIPVIAHLHNNPPWLKRICPKSIAFALALPHIRQVVSVSKAIENEYVFRALMKNKNAVLGNVVNIETVHRKAEEPCDCTQVDLVFLGRMNEPKCPLLFCQIVELIKSEHPSITARMIGDGDLMPQVQEYIRSHALECTIELVGFQSNPYPYLNTGKIMVMPSAWEGFGLVAVEAMCLGKPVVCSGAGGLADIVDENCGAKCERIEEYCRTIIELLQIEKTYIKMSENAKNRSKRYANMSEYKTVIKSVYNKALRGD